MKFDPTRLFAQSLGDDGWNKHGINYTRAPNKRAKSWKCNHFPPFTQKKLLIYLLRQMDGEPADIIPLQHALEDIRL